MKYMGSKNRIAKHILPIMLECKTKEMTWVEPFVGGANMIDKVEGKRIGNDNNKYLIELWKALQNGWIPPDFISEGEWKNVKDKMTSEYEKHYIAFVRLGCSFGADWNGGYARNVRKDKPNAELLNSTTKSYCGQSKRNMLKQLPSIRTVDFRCEDYLKMNIPSNSLIYCDPPYEGTTKYKDDFNHVSFWQWCRDKANEGHVIFVSEYNAPDDFLCVWKHELNNTLNNTAETNKVTEKLFKYISD